MNVNTKFLILALYQLERYLINQNFWKYLDLPKVSNPHGGNFRAGRDFTGHLVQFHIFTEEQIKAQTKKVSDAKPQLPVTVFLNSRISQECYLANSSH